MNVNAQSAISRRRFAAGLALSIASVTLSPVRAQKARRLSVGHTGITWGFEPADAQAAVKDVAGLGYQRFESFGNVLETWEKHGGFDALLRAADLHLRAAYCPVNLTELARRKDAIARIVRWGGLIKKCGGSVAVIGPNQVKRDAYDFASHKTNIVQALNDIGKALDDIGVLRVLHQHTDTCVETRDETYAVSVHAEAWLHLSLTIYET